MKKLFIHIIFILTVVICNAQNSGIDISFAHTPQGKEWKRAENPDGPQVPASMKNDIFVFYSNGSFVYKQQNTTARELPGTTTKTWSYNPETNVLAWDLTQANGIIKKYRAEITYIDAERIVMNLSENGQEPTIFILIQN